MHSKNETGLYEVEIDGKKYEFEKWGAESSLATLIKIAKIAGKPLGIFLGSAVSGNGLKTEISPDLMASACEALVQNMDEQNCINLIKKLSSEKVLCDGRKINFDTHYEDQLSHLFRVVKASLEIQYGNFLQELLLIIGAQQFGKMQTSKITNHK
jgi:hypothetical protein